MFNPANVPQLHDLATAHWHTPATAPVAAEDIETLILEQHHANFDLWHTEDKARGPQVSGQDMIDIKHTIDALNQRRNDLAEKLDTALLAVVPPQPALAPLHSETPGLMIDRLSILALKIFHTAEEAHREGATPEHHKRNRDRLALLLEQRNDLAACLVQLWAQVFAGERRFKLYRQMKMYNDPSLNPVLYGASERST